MDFLSVLTNIIYLTILYIIFFRTQRNLYKASSTIYRQYTSLLAPLLLRGFTCPTDEVRLTALSLLLIH